MPCIQDPAQAQEFVEKTGCDSLAIAIGTSHGAYKFKGEAKLRFDILKEIKERIPKHTNCITWSINSYSKISRNIHSYVL